jgi:hypothetical protein
MRRIPRIAVAACFAVLVGRPGTAQVPPDFPEITVSTLHDPAPGYIFMSNFTFDTTIENTPYLMVLDNSGWPVHALPAENALNLDFKLQPDGFVTYNDMAHFIRLDPGLAPVDTFRAGNGWFTDSHELRILPDGHALLLGWRVRISDMTGYGGWPFAMLQDYVIQEVDADGNVYWEWSTADHFSIADATRDIDRTSLFIDWVHCNAIEIDTDGNILLSSRHLDEITKIDRTTGEIVWRLGGRECRNNQFVFIDDLQEEGGDTLFYGFSHQHGVRRLENGNILLFDNGNLKDPPYTRVVEYMLDEVEKTATRVWEYRHTPGIFSSEMGFAQRLANGNTLIGWGGNHTSGVAVTEVTPDGETAFELSMPDEILSYRAFRYVFDMAAVTRTVDRTGGYDFDEPGEETGLAIDVHALSGAGAVTVQRHEYAAHALSFAGGGEPDTVYPYRWTITEAGVSLLDGTVRFDLSSLPGIPSPSSARIYRRDAEGQGTFGEVTTLYDDVGDELLGAGVGPGEYIIAAPIPTGGIVERPPHPPLAVALAQNVPNPFNPRTDIRFSVGAEGEEGVELAVYSMRGRKVRTLVARPMAAGRYTVGWDGTDDHGRGLPSGAYLYRLRSGDRVVTRKMLMAK